MLLIFFFLIIIFGLLTGKIKLEIKEMKIASIDNRVMFEYDIFLKIYVFNFIKIFQRKLNHLQSKNLIKKISKTKLKIKGNTINKQIDIIRRIILRFNEVQIDISIGIDDIFLTVYTVVIVSSLIPFFIESSSRKMYKILPLYNMGNRIEIELKGISEIKFVHIIHMIFILFKERGKLNEWRK